MPEHVGRFRRGPYAGRLIWFPEPPPVYWRVPVRVGAFALLDPEPELRPVSPETVIYRRMPGYIETEDGRWYEFELDHG
jgi:hypothetical protein